MESEKEQDVTRSAHRMAPNCISYCSDDKNNGTTNTIHNFTNVSTAIIEEEANVEETEQHQHKEEKQQGREEASTDVTCPSNTTADSKAIRSRNHTTQSVRRSNLLLGEEEAGAGKEADGKTIYLHLNNHASDISGAWDSLLNGDTIPDLKNIMRNYDMHCKKWSWLIMQFEKIVDEVIDTTKPKNQSYIYQHSDHPSASDKNCTSKNEYVTSLTDDEECSYDDRNTKLEPDSQLIKQLDSSHYTNALARGQESFYKKKSCYTQTDKIEYESRMTSTSALCIITKDCGSCYTPFRNKSLDDEEEILESRVQRMVDAVMLVMKATSFLNNNATGSTGYYTPSTPFGSLNHEQQQEVLLLNKVKDIIDDDKRDDCYKFNDIILLKQKFEFYHSASVLNKLLYLERAVLQNIFRKKQLKYRNIPYAPTTIHFNDANADLKSILIEYLLSFKCSLTDNKTVTSMCWHNVSKDILAVGYSSRSNKEEYKVDKCGIVMLWSIRNPMYPEIIFKTKTAVSALSFASLSPTILAVGMVDGSISLHDTSYKNGECNLLLSTSNISGRHMEPVTQLQWINDKQQSSGAEKLLSLSIDGRVIQWLIKREMCLQQLMVLKCQPTSGIFCGGENPTFSFPLMGLCMDVHKENNSLLYVVGCDDGSLFFSLCSYTERPMLTVKAHSSAIASVKFSPLNCDILASCSSDSTIKIWKLNERKDNIANIKTLHRQDLWASVNDIVWSPNIATLLIAITGDGRIDVWDISKSTLDPLRTLQENSDGAEWTKILFEKDGNAIIVADDHGSVKALSFIHN